MTRMLLALAVCAVAAVTEARADFGTPPVPSQSSAAPMGSGESTVGQYGWNPIFKRLAFWKKKDDCGAGKCADGKCGPRPGAGVPGIPGNGMAMPGTLVFPTHPFNRSPRDYFMYGHGGN